MESSTAGSSFPPTSDPMSDQQANEIAEILAEREELRAERERERVEMERNERGEDKGKGSGKGKSNRKRKGDDY